MPVRSYILGTGEYYHVFNRGVARQPIFSTSRDYERFLLCLSYYRFLNPPYKLSRFLDLNVGKREEVLDTLELKNKRLVKIISYCLMPNHFHLLLEQEEDGGITNFITHLSDSYTRYYNTKTERVGPLFQGIFKAVHVENDEQLLHVSRYIHLNPLVSFIVKEEDFLFYSWSSLGEYQKVHNGFTSTEPILAHFNSREAYIEFVLNQVDYAKELEKIKHLTLE